MLNRAILWSVISSIAVSALMIVAFASALWQFQHERGVAIMTALPAFNFAREARIAFSKLRGWI